MKLKDLDGELVVLAEIVYGLLKTKFCLEQKVLYLEGKIDATSFEETEAWRLSQQKRWSESDKDREDLIVRARVFCGLLGLWKADAEALSAAVQCSYLQAAEAIGALIKKQDVAGIATQDISSVAGRVPIWRDGCIVDFRGAR